MTNENYYVVASIVDEVGLWLPTRVHSMTSVMGHAYQILIRCPAGPVPAEGWPVAYVLDHGLFKTLDPEPSASGVLVGIGYLDDDRRAYHYTPMVNVYGISPLTQPQGSGGAGEFLDFLLHELKTWVQANYRIDIRHQSLIGHSLGGLFALNTLFQSRAAFQTYLVSSPSVWWADHFLFKVMQSIASGVLQYPSATAARVAITVGEHEQSLSPSELERDLAYQEQQLTRRTARRMVDGSAELARILRKVDGLKVSFQILEGQTHIMAGPRSLLEHQALIFSR